MQRFYDVLMEKRGSRKAMEAMYGARDLVAGALSHLHTQPYVISGAVGGGLAGAAVAGKGKRTKGALGGALIGGLTGKGLHSGLSHLALKRGASMGDLERAALVADTLKDHSAVEDFLEGIKRFEPRPMDPRLLDPVLMFSRMKALTAAGDADTRRVMGKALGAGAAAGATAGGLTTYGLRKRREKKQQEGS